ncbi:MAG: GNAT family N-acetyltransferase [Burkholderiales bacterium]|nr:GNAT family N-acetyltransferase [Anaerolineae bacterium]
MMTTTNMQIVRNTPRLLLRRLDTDDISAVHRMLNDEDVARMLIGIPHPISREWTGDWVTDIDAAIEWGIAFNFAITRKSDDALMGCVGLDLNAEYRRAELGYWIGRSYWGQGYATEAARRMLRFGFDEIGLNRITSTVFPHNSVSAHVLDKLGMKYEATLRRSIFKWDHYEDLDCYGLLKSEFKP